jgi:hypothetical protein
MLGFWYWRAKRAGDRAKELVPTGIYRSPLYWISSTLALILLALAIYMGHIHAALSTSPILWIAAVVIIVALLFMRRALKWRYPV